MLFALGIAQLGQLYSRMGHFLHNVTKMLRLSRYCLRVMGKSKIESLTQVFPEIDLNLLAKRQIPVFFKSRIF